MSDRCDRVIARIREIHAKAEEHGEIQNSDVILFTHGHFTRSFIARWCLLPVNAGYHFVADAGGVSDCVMPKLMGRLRFSVTSTTRSRSPVSVLRPSPTNTLALIGLNWYTEVQINSKP